MPNQAQTLIAKSKQNDPKNEQPRPQHTIPVPAMSIGAKGGLGAGGNNNARAYGTTARNAGTWPA